MLALAAALCGCPGGASPDGGAADAGLDGGVLDGGAADAGLCEPYDAGPGPAALGVLADYCAAVARGAGQDDTGALITCGAPLRPEDRGHRALFRPTCESGTLALRVRQLERSVRLGRLAYEPLAMEACRALGRSADAGATPWGEDGGLVGPCQQVLLPLVGEGGACDFTEECSGGTFCRPAGPQSCGGACVARLAEGATCDAHVDVCGDGLACAVDGLCRPRQASGPCTDSQQCLPGHQCVAGQCVTLSGAGGPCSATSASGCEGGLTCVAEDGGATCRPRAATGEACRGRGCAAACDVCSVDAGVCVVRSAAGVPCATSGECLEGLECGPGARCVPRPRRGEPCVPSGVGGNCLYLDDVCERRDGGAVCSRYAVLGERCGAVPCATGAYCPRASQQEQGVCTPLPRAGERCGSTSLLSSTCEGEAFCDMEGCLPGEGLCRPLRAVGQPCRSDIQCELGACVEDRCAQRCNELARAGCLGGLRDQFGALVFFGGLVLVGRRRRSGHAALVAIDRGFRR
ncbi:MAG: hypothetical protein AMXMBFR34_52220 [Myxococcaceae bacterium]